MEKPSSEDVLKFASDAGRVLLENGAEISRVEETMERIADNYGESGERFFVLSNGIFTTGKSYANAEFIPMKGARLEKVVEVNQLSREIAAHKIPLPQAVEMLERIKNLPSKPVLEQFLGAGLGCAVFGMPSFFRAFLTISLTAIWSALLNPSGIVNFLLS